MTALILCTQCDLQELEYQCVVEATILQPSPNVVGSQPDQYQQLQNPNEQLKVVKLAYIY